MKTMKWSLTFFWFLLTVSSLYADGLQFDGDRYAGAVVVLEMTPDQKKSEDKIDLTEDQIETIFEATGKKIKWLYKMDVKSAKEGCT